MVYLSCVRSGETKESPFGAYASQPHNYRTYEELLSPWALIFGRKVFCGTDDALDPRMRGDSHSHAAQESCHGTTLLFQQSLLPSVVDTIYFRMVGSLF